MRDRLAANPLVCAEFGRPAAGPRFAGGWEGEAVQLTGLPGWVSSGGPTPKHPARANPCYVEVPVRTEALLSRVHLVGIFGEWAGEANEALGAMGASLQFFNGSALVHSAPLIYGRHYRDAACLDHLSLMPGDGTSVETIGMAEHDGRSWRVDRLSVDLPDAAQVDRIVFRDAGTPSVFVLFDVVLEYEAARGCPFHSKHGGIPLAEIPAIVRVGDRLRLRRAIRQLEKALDATYDLDEARGSCLTFIAVLTAASLERGAERSMVRIQLDAARRFDQIESVPVIKEEALQIVEGIVAPLFANPSSPSAYLVDHALRVLERNFAKDLSDAEVAEQLGLSTSHFRYLFREATGQPFHKFLIATRLERARQMLVDESIPVSDVAAAVGFSNASHFSRAFAQRFGASPIQVRRSAL